MAEKDRFLKGQLLLDSGQLRGSFFQRTVVLICQHDAEGAFGLVLNRDYRQQRGRNDRRRPAGSLKGCPLYLGGPVQPSALSFLHSDAFLPDANVIPNLSLGHSLDDLVELGDSLSPDAEAQDVRRLCRLESGPARRRDEAQGLADAPGVAGTGFRHRRPSSSGRRSCARKGGNTSCWRRCRRICRRTKPYPCQREPQMDTDEHRF